MIMNSFESRVLDYEGHPSLERCDVCGEVWPILKCYIRGVPNVAITFNGRQFLCEKCNQPWKPILFPNSPS